MQEFNSKQKSIELIDIISEEYQLEINDFLKKRFPVDSGLAWLLELLTIKTHLSNDYLISIVVCAEKYGVCLESIIKFLETKEYVLFRDIMRFMSSHEGTAVDNDDDAIKYNFVNLESLARDTRELNVMLVACINEAFQEDIGQYLIELYGIRELGDYLQECSQYL